MAHKWAKWLRHPCRLGDPHRCRAGGEIGSGPLMGKVATTPLPSQGSPPLQSGGGKSEVAHNWAKWLRHPCRLGDPRHFRAGEKSEVAQLWAKWLRHPCRLGDPHCCRAGGEIGSGSQVGKVATSPVPSRGSPPLQSEGENQKWPTCGQSGYVTPCRLRDRHRCRAGGKTTSGPLMGKVATSPLPSRGSPPLRSAGGGNQKWPTSGQSGYVTPAVSGIATAAERGGGNSEVAHLWAKWLCHPCRLGDAHRCRAGGGGNEKWPTSGQSGYVTPAVSGIPTATERLGGGNEKWPTSGQSAHDWATSDFSSRSATVGIPDTARVT